MRKCINARMKKAENELMKELGIEIEIAKWINNLDEVV